MWKWWAAAAMVLSAAGCAATDEPYVPPSATVEVDTTPGPVNPEIFAMIEKAESTVDGVAVAVESRLRAYTVSVVADGELVEVTVVGSGIIKNPIGEADDELETFLESKVVTLADAIDAAANAYPGTVVSAEVDLTNSPHYVVMIESDDDAITAHVDASSADVSIASESP